MESLHEKCRLTAPTAFSGPRIGRAEVAVSAVRGALATLREFLTHVEALVTDPDWHPRMPTVEESSRSMQIPPVGAEEAWRGYVAAQRPLLRAVAGQR